MLNKRQITPFDLFFFNEQNNVNLLKTISNVSYRHSGSTIENNGKMKGKNREKKAIYRALQLLFVTKKDYEKINYSRHKSMAQQLSWGNLQTDF
jgi:hypothetical protein